MEHRGQNVWLVIVQQGCAVGWVFEALGGAGSCAPAALATKSFSSPMPRVCLSRSKYELQNARSKENNVTVMLSTGVVQTAHFTF